MGDSDDEEDFLSADEGDEKLQLATPVIEASKEIVAGPNFQEKSNSQPTKRTQNEPFNAYQSAAGISDSIDDERNTTLETSSSTGTGNSTTSVSVPQRNATSSFSEDVDEDAIAERIRERNLRIARKFSAQIAKTVKASAPIPVISTQSQLETALDPNDLDTSNSSAEDSKCVSCPPPAPPPTPALSSSLTNSELLSSSSSQDTTKYGWRVPVAAAGESGPKLAQGSLSTSIKSEQAARLALDRLSERLSQTDNNRNLFEQVADDIKKVSLNRDESANEQASGGIPIISDLSGTLGTFGWNSASKFFSSASQVTSRVGTSVLDSVVQVTQQATRSKEPTTAPDSNQKSAHTIETAHTNLDETGSPSIQTPDAIVGMTLDAMESLGKRAFGVMTERDESGSIQIKGLGRPWEHLMNITKPSTSDPNSSSHTAKETSQAFEQDDEHEMIETFQSTTSSDLTSTSTSYSASGLKNRRKNFS